MKPNAWSDDAIEALKKDMMAQVNGLMQRDSINSKDASMWVDYVANLMPEEAGFHLNRLKGVGGSDIGGLVRNYLGYRADFEFSARGWVEEKLMITPPRPSSGVLQRGIQMEELHRHAFYEEYKVKRDNAAFQNLASNHLPDRPWVRYSPDDMVSFDKPTSILFGDEEIEVEGRFLIDYKSPTTVDKNNVSFQYACQLHQGALISQENGVSLTGTILSQWDWAKWEMHNDLILINPELCDLIKETSDYYWECVLNAHLPQYVRTQEFELDERTRDNWEPAIERLSLLSALRTQLDNEAKALRDKISKGLGLHEKQLGSQRVVFKDKMNISATTSFNSELIAEKVPAELIEQMEVKNTTTSYDTPALVRKLKELDVDVGQFRKMKRLDSSKAFDILSSNGYNPDDFITESPRFTVNRSVSEKAKDWVHKNFQPLVLPEKESESALLTPTENSDAEQNRQAKQESDNQQELFTNQSMS